MSELSVGNDAVRRSNSSVRPNVNVEIDKSRRNTDPSNFVTVIEVNGLKAKNNDEEIISSKKKVPPK